MVLPRKRALALALLCCSTVLLLQLRRRQREERKERQRLKTSLYRRRTAQQRNKFRKLCLRMKNVRKLLREDLDLPCKELAHFLLGKLLVRRIDENTVLKARIVETECYLGNQDRASHSFGGRQTPGNQPMYMPAGTAYVYMTYGMYHCFNISSKEPGAAVLLRALEPTQNIEEMRKLRAAKRKSANKQFQDTEICNGPSKLCMSMNITKYTCNKVDMCNNDTLWIELDSEERDDFQIVTTSRIGIASAGAEWASKPLRFYILDNPNVSKRDKKAEEEVRSRL